MCRWKSPANRTRESLDIQRTSVFDQIKTGKPLSKEYLLRGQRIAKERITTSGYQLAEVLNRHSSHNH
ncbi:S1/P1 nuclease [Endozoicomonas sp. ONNA1]|uniref:S1/P1 nuclease n=1 Tax=unclassified Endozoicomonas TaxID=2644528 RepID=UPI0034D36C1D